MNVYVLSEISDKVVRTSFVISVYSDFKFCKEIKNRLTEIHPEREYKIEKFKLETPEG